MPRFYFDSREGSRFIPDDERVEFLDLDAAEQEAATGQFEAPQRLLVVPGDETASRVLR
jgi:hypothetical protein